MAVRPVAEFLAEPAPDLPTLVDALHTAAALELATLPPYLCGKWSVIDQSDPVAMLIETITGDEMMHLGLVLNMTTAIGGQPALVPPVYPGPLPAGIRPDLTVTLQGLTLDYVADVFMQIEYPEAPIDEPVNGPTIGRFYDWIQTAFDLLQPAIDPNAVQQTIAAVFPITSLADVKTAITTIKEQGEGTSQSPDAVDTPDPTEVAHYYAFGEVYHQAKIVEVDGQWQYTGAPLPFPECYPMAVVPAGGWTGVADDVAKLLATFDGAFGDLIDSLNAAWSPGGTMDAALACMGELPGPAVELMRIPVPGGTGNYGPDFVVRQGQA